MSQAVTKPPVSPEAKLRQQLTSMAPQFAMALPSHIKPEKFQRVVMTIVQQSPDLLTADRRSLLGACIKCASDGLVPDGREAAIVLFKGKPQYMPMIAGLLKRARNSGDLAGVTAQVVYSKDEFVQQPDDFEKPLTHRPPPLGQDRGTPIGAYAQAKLKDGTIVAEVMSKPDIEKVRAVSRASGNGPWVTWPDEMWKKTVFRRLSKWLPMDAEDADRIDQTLRRDDALGKPDGDADAAPAYIDGDAEVMPSKLDILGGAPVIENELPADDSPGVATPREEGE